MNVTNAYDGLDRNSSVGNLLGNGTGSMPGIARPTNIVINVLTLSILLITMVSLGCSMELSKIRGHFYKPKGILIAMLAQFCVMPLTAFSLTKVLHMGPIKTLMVLICGCCPGGNLSNIFSLALHGDMNLSIVMTTCSSLVALGMMPLLLYIFSQGFPGLENAVPYRNIITTLVFTLLPCTVGIAINHFRPKKAKYILRIGMGIMMALSVVVLSLSLVAVKDMLWMILQLDIFLVSVVMPLVGFTLGYIMSAVCRLSPQCSRTISMETGCQNIQLCTTILKVAFPPQVIGPLFLFPLVYISFQCAEALLLILCFRCYRMLKKPAEDEPLQTVEAKQEEKLPHLSANDGPAVWSNAGSPLMCQNMTVKPNTGGRDTSK